MPSSRAKPPMGLKVTHQLSQNGSKAFMPRFNENDYESYKQTKTMASNRLLGNRQAFLNNTSQAVNEADQNTKPGRDTTAMSNSTKVSSEVQVNEPQFDIANPHDDLELTEEELEIIYSRPYMNPEHGQSGVNPESNQILESENLLLDSKHEKLMELMKANSDIHDLIESYKNDPDMLQVTSGQGIDLPSI